MAYKVLISKRASFQLEKLAAYLLTVLNNQQACAHFFDEIQKTYDMLKNDPLCFKQCPEELLAQKGYRSVSLPTMRYRIIYRIEGKTVFVVAIFHTLEDYLRKL